MANGFLRVLRHGGVLFMVGIVAEITAASLQDHEHRKAKISAAAWMTSASPSPATGQIRFLHFVQSAVQNTP
jgi:hypothetical protein